MNLTNYDLRKINFTGISNDITTGAVDLGGYMVRFVSQLF